jgi:hypothetical protein
MPIIVVDTEKNFAELHPRLFADKVSNKAAGEVAEAVRKANPHADLDKLTPGTVLTVPDSSNVRVRGELSLDETTTSAISNLADFGKAAIGEVADGAAKREADAKAERSQALKSLDAIGSGTAKPRERGLAKDLETARKALVEEDAQAEERASRLEKAQAEWTAGLDALKNLVG